eukprot:TRINITY_DN37026_c0_g1_i1.p3 TRINITY_DN37026_c0_g1~~TRINITY_DN37026_c0_g1_i1.p3  ORF type:complete len:120 (+),score=3.29 TRINITY_DN37026_c0_g1_i1:31-390(+)
MTRRPQKSTLSSSSAASDVYKRQGMREVMKLASLTPGTCNTNAPPRWSSSNWPLASVSFDNHIFATSTRNNPDGVLLLFFLSSLTTFMRSNTTDEVGIHADRVTSYGVDAWGGALHPSG